VVQGHEAVDARLRVFCMIPDEHNPARSYAGLSVRDRPELLAFDARLAGVPPALLEALWEAIDLLRVDVTPEADLQTEPRRSTTTSRPTQARTRPQ
jgi:hypothetical protein